MNGNIQRTESNNNVTIIKFEKTEVNLSGLSTKTISEPKIQELSTVQILDCIRNAKYKYNYLCKRLIGAGDNIRDTNIELNKRFGMPIFIPFIVLITCFLLSSRRENKFYNYQKYIFFFIGFAILVGSEIGVRYSGLSWGHTLAYYLIPIIYVPLVYLLLTRTFKFENLHT